MLTKILNNTCRKYSYISNYNNCNNCNNCNKFFIGLVIGTVCGYFIGYKINK
jgi:hypothetical protein